MWENKWFIRFLTAFIIWIYILLFSILYNFLFWEDGILNTSYLKPNSNWIEKELKNHDIKIESIYETDKKLIFLPEWCEVNDKNIKELDIATPDDRFYTSKESWEEKTPTKKLYISWDLGNIYFCIIPDISNKKASYSDYRKWYNAVTYLKVWKYYGAIDVWYSKNSGQFYDFDSHNSTKVKEKMFGKYWTEELPYRQILDLQNNIIFADTKNGGTTKINIKDELSDGNTINIGWYMTKLGSEAYRASSIKNFRILRDWDWTIEIL